MRQFPKFYDQITVVSVVPNDASWRSRKVYKFVNGLTNPLILTGLEKA